MRKIYVAIGVVVLGVLAVVGYLLSQGVLHIGIKNAPEGSPPELASTTESNASSTEAVEQPIDTSPAPVPLLMALDMKKWEWQEARYPDGKVVTPAKSGVFTLSFGGSGTVEIGTDCNSMSSTYEAYNGALTFGPIAGTKMYCEGSQEVEFSQLLSNFATYQFTGKSELIVKTKDNATVIFK
ncbi:MAG: hypothetical protein RLZZ480_738 [Candidatus Parcubacteria bacterium]|jgi:heat shock protein HslJ